MSDYDIRYVPGTCGTATITWYEDEEGYRVALTLDDRELYAVETTDVNEAGEAYLHLFARPDVPDIFKRESVEIIPESRRVTGQSPLQDFLASKGLVQE